MLPGKRSGKWKIFPSNFNPLFTVKLSCRRIINFGGWNQIV